MNRTFSKQGWNDFVEWVNEDRKVARRIVLLLNDIERNGNEGLGKPEALRNRLSGYWSRRITEKTISISASCQKQIKKMKDVFDESSFIDAQTGKQTLKKK